MKNKVIILIIAFGLFSCKKDKIYEKQIGKWEVYYHYRNWSLLYQDTFTMEVYQNRKLQINSNTFSQNWPNEIYWMTSLDEKRLEFNYFDTIKNDVVPLIRWKITKNTENQQQWDWIENMGVEYTQRMTLNRLEWTNTNKETIHFKKHLSISTNEQNHQIWEKNTTDDPEYPTFTVMELTRIE